MNFCKRNRRSRYSCRRHEEEQQRWCGCKELYGADDRESLSPGLSGTFMHTHIQSRRPPTCKIIVLYVRDCMRQTLKLVGVYYTFVYHQSEAVMKAIANKPSFKWTGTPTRPTTTPRLDTLSTLKVKVFFFLCV